MIDAALALFTEKGFDRTSLSDIVARSKGSRATLYELFGNKEGLPKAMVAQACDRIWQAVDAPLADDLPIATALECLGLRFTRAILLPSTIAVTRLIIAEGPRCPELIQFFFQIGPDPMRHRMAEHLLRAAEKGELLLPEPEVAVLAFLGMLAADYNFRLLSGQADGVDDAVLTHHVRTTVAIYLNGLRPRI